MTASSGIVRSQIYRSPLARRLVIAIVLVSSAITLILTALQLYYSYRADISEIESDFALIQEVHIKAISASLWAANRKELQLQIDGIVEIPGMAYVAVIENDKPWAEAGTMPVDNLIEKIFPLTYRYRGKNLQIGQIVVMADYSAVYERLIDRAVVILASNAFKTFLVAIFILAFFYYQVNRPLLQLTDYLHNLDANEYKGPIELPKISGREKDELDELAEAVTLMHESIYLGHQELTRAKEKFHAIADYTIDWESWIGVDGELLWVNPSVARQTGYSPDDCYQMNDYPASLIHGEENRNLVRRSLLQSTSGNTADGLLVQIKTRDGDLPWFSLSWQPIYNSQGQFSGHSISAREVTKLKQIEQELEQKIQQLVEAEAKQENLLKQARDEEARMVSLLAAMNFGILFEDIDSKIVYYNPSFRRIWLIPDTVDLRGRNTEEVLKQSANVLSRPDHFSKHILQVVGTQKMSESFEIELADGRILMQLSYMVHDTAGRFIGRLWIYEDVTHERQTAEQLIYLAERDSLTGLHNRHRFQEELSRLMAKLERRDAQGALLFFDLDDFKYINDTFGHRAGDTVLVRIAGDVGALIRHNEFFARVGGDEFAVLIPEASLQQAIQLAERIIRAISQIPFNFDGQNMRITTSVGIARYPEHGTNVEELVAHADSAMYKAKDNSKNAWCEYSYDLDASREMLNRMTWHQRVSNALENDLLRLHFQGIYEVDSGKLVHLEALVRMVDETEPGRLIMPGHFIQIAERTGQIVDIDRWVISRSVQILAATPSLEAMAINISGRSFDDLTLPKFIQSELSTYKVSARRLIVELTETSAVTDLHDAQRFIESLRQTGCQTCLDDFGSGFSSFAYLKYLRADILKIDGVFIRDLPNDRDNQVFVKAMVDVAKGMNKITVAEFVEDAATLNMLKEFGVDLAQGYHLDMPVANHPVLVADAG